METPIAIRDARMADGGRDRCFEDIVCILFKDEKRATVVVSMVIQLLRIVRVSISRQLSGSSGNVL